MTTATSTLSWFEWVAERESEEDYAPRHAKRGTAKRRSHDGRHRAEVLEPALVDA